MSLHLTPPQRLSVMLVVPDGLVPHNGARFRVWLVECLPPVGRAGPAGVA
jgi:hypothetical protein